MFEAESARLVKERDYSHSLVARITELENYCDSIRLELEQQTTRATSAVELLKEKNVRLEMMQQIYNDEREERRLLSDRMQRAAGFITPDPLVIGHETVEEVESLTRKSRSRGHVLRELETRAVRLEQEHREKEARAIADGTLAPGSSIDGIPVADIKY